MKAIQQIDPQIVELVLKRYRKEMRKICEEEAERAMEKKATDLDTVALTIMHEKRGYGPKRLNDFIEDWVEIYDYYNHRYDDADLYVMKRNLLKLGIDVDKLRERLEKKGAET